MNATQYKRALKKLGLTAYSAAPLFDLTRRQSQRYAAGDAKVPGLISRILELLISGKITIRDLTGEKA